LGVGPVITKEELTYLREIGPHDTVTVNLRLSHIEPDGKSYELHQEFFRSDGKRAAIVKISGLWIDMKTRKRCDPPKKLREIFNKLEHFKEKQ